MYILKNPNWAQHDIHDYTKIEEVPQHIFNAINRRLDLVTSTDPLVSIVIGAWNEEVNILNCISSLSRATTTIPFEIIVVNNNSTDDTQKTIDALHVRSVFQEVQGNGPARQKGQEVARGKFILLADADCIYPPCWVDKLLDTLRRPGVACVYGRYSFLEEPGFPRWKLFLLEKLKDVIAEIRHIKRPYLNAFGISMGYIRDYGLKVGFIDRNIRGNDGRLCFDLMSYGKIKQVRNNAARPWTGPRTLQRDGNLNQAFKKRLLTELMRLPSFLKPHPPHNTKLSDN